MKTDKTHRQQLAAARRARNAVESFKTFSDLMVDTALAPGLSLFGITRGQFSMIDVIRYFVERLQPADVSVWTWAIASYEVEAFEFFYQTQAIRSATLIVDRSAEDRNAELIDRWRARFGTDSVKVCKTHAKIATIAGRELRILARGSMNLNENPRFEQFDISEGGQPYELVKRIERQIPTLPPRCSNHDADAASGLLFAWAEDRLATFGGVRPWQP